MAGQLHEEFLKGVKFLRENKVFEGLPPEEVRETKKRIKEVNDQILGLEKKLREYETKKALSLEEAELADIAQSVRDSSGKVKNTMMDFFSGVVRLGSTMPARVAGYGAHVVGAKETGKKLTQFAEDKDTAFEMVAPPAGADAGLAETIVSAGARSLAPSLMTGAVGAGVAGAIGKIPAVATALGGSAKLAGRIDTAARLFATTATMSADEVLRSSTKTDEMGGVVLPENALPVMAGTLAHAAIENVAGITPFKMISQTKFANKFLNREGVRAIRTGIKKLGLKGAIGEFVKETAGEGAEEYLQGITEDVTAIFAHAPSITEAVQASYELIADWDYHKGKSREFVVGAGVGALYSGMFRARAVIENKHASIEQKKEAMAMLESARAAREELGIVQQHLDTMMGARAEIARAELDDLQDRLRESGIKRYGDVQQLREELYNIVENGSRSEQPRDLEVYEGEAESVPYVEAEEVDAVWGDLIAELRAARDRAELEDKQLVPVEDVATKGEPTQGAELDRVEATQELGRIAAPEEKKLIGEPKRKLLAEPEVKAEAEAKPEPEAEPEAKPEQDAEPEVKAEQDAEKTDKLIRFIKDIISTNEALGNHKRNEEIKKKLAELELAKSGGTVEEGEVVARQVFGHPLATNIEGYQNLIPVKARDRGTIEGKIEQLQKHIDRLQTLWAYVDVVANGKMKPSKNPRYAFPQLKGLKTKKDFQRYKESADFGQVEVELNLLKTETRPELERMLKLFKKVEPEAKPEAKAEAEKAEPEAKAEAEAKPEPEAEPEVKPVEVEQHVADTIDGWKIERRKTFNKRQYKTFLEGETLGAHGKVSVTDDGGVTNSKFAIFGNATDPELFKLFKENTAFANPVPRKVLAGLQSKPINCTNFKYEYTENARGKNPVIVYSAEFEGERIYLRGNEHVYRYLKNRIPDLGIEAHAQREDATIAYFKDGKGEIVAMEVLMPERASEYQTSAKSISEALDGGYKKPESEKEFALKKAEREFLRAFRPSGRIGSILRTSPSGDITDGMFMIKGKYVPEEMRKAANSERYNDGDITDEEIGWITKNLEDGEHEPTVVGERKLPDSKDTEVVLKYQGTWNRPTAYASVLKPVLDYLGGLSEDTKMTVTPRGMLIFRSADGDLQAVAMTRSIEDATVGEGYADKVKERREQQEAEERELAKKRKELEQEEEAKARAEQERKRQDELAEEDKEYSGFLKGKTTLQRANAVKTLQLHGRKVYIDNLHRRGLLGIGTHEENKIKDPSRRTYNRWGWEQQQEHERRVREAGKKTVYEIRNTSTENLYREATKTEYEYAKHLLEQQKAESEVKAEPEDYSQDIDKEHARRAHSGTSFDPEKRGDSEVKGYNEQLQKVKTELLELAKTEEQKALAEEKFGQYRKKYKELFEAYLSSRSKVMSTMITGPANFPVARNKKANEAVDSKLKALQWFHEKFMRQAKKEIAPDASGRVSSDSPDAIEQLQKRLANREAAHEQMKKANAILRSKKLTDAEKIAKMQEAGVSEATAKGLLAGREYPGKVGFPPFALTNSNAEIKRIKDRIAELTKKQSQSTTETSFDGGKIVDNVEDNRLQIFYEGKPDSETIAKLKKSGFRWAPSKGAWQAYRNESSKRKAEAITGAKSIKLYSVEQAVAEATMMGYKLLKKGITKFAEWARAMVEALGEKVKPILRGLYKELQNPTYSSKPRMGAINWEQKREQVAEGKGLSQERLEGEPLQEWAERKIAAGQVMAEMDAADDAREAEIGKPVRAPSKSKVEAERKATEKRIEAEAKSTADIIMAAHKRTEKAAAEAKKALEKARAYIQEGKEREAKLTKAVEEATPKTIMDSWRKALDNAIDLLADQWAPIKRLQETVEKATGQKLTDEYNVYKLIETVQGRKSEHIKEAEGKYYDPIVNSLIKAKILLSDFNEYLYARAAFARNRMIAKRAGNPFALTGEPGSGMSDKEAQSIIDKVAKLPNAAEYAAIAEQVYALNNFLLDEQVRLGLITPQAREAYQKYEDYVPLKRPPEHGFILDRSALGRRSKASNHLEYINQAITATYTRAFNREINQAVIKLFELTEQPLLYSKVKPKRVLVKGKKKDVIKVETEKFIGKDEYVWQRTGKNDYIVYKIHDEGLRHAIKGAKVTDSIGSKILNVFATNNKWMAFTATGGNPEFLLKNPIRDIQQAMAYTATHISFSSAAKFPKHLAQASSILTEHNLTGKENELLRAFKLGGGLVGYSEFYSIEQQAKDLDKTIQKGIKGGVVYMSGEAVKKAVGVVAKWNSTLETMTRFAAYLNAKEAGLTELSALAHAKNVTVNFNKKGTMGHILNSLYVFAGANLGGNLNTAQILKKAMQTRKGQVMVAGAIALGAALEMINFNIAGEDDDGVNYYDKLPNYVKDLSYVFMLPGTKGKYIAIPMPYGLAMLPAFGRNMAAYYRGGQHVGKTVANLYSAFMDSFNPLGGDERGLLSDAVPSAIKPFFDVWSNTKWTGKRLRPEQDVFGSEVAISELTYPSDSKAAKEFAKWLNEVSGGDRYNSGWATYFSPGELDHLVLSYTGGLGKFLKRSADLLVKDKDEIELKEIPVSRVFYGEPGEYSTHQTFRENVELVRKYRRAVSEGDRIGMKKMKHLKKADDLLKDTERRIRHVRKVNKDQKKRDAYELALRKNFNKKMRNFNK